MVKRFFHISLFFLLMVPAMLVSCHGKSGREASAPDSVPPTGKAAFRVALVPTTACLPYLVAQRCGFYDSLSLPVEFVMCGDVAACDHALAKSKADAAYTDVFRAVVMQQAGIDVGLVTGFDEELCLVVGRTTRLRRTESLLKRMVAIDRFSAADYLCDRVAAYAHIDPEEIYRPQINNLVLRGRMLINNQIEAAVLPQPWALALNMQGHPTLFSSTRLKQNYAVLAARPENFRAKRRQFIKLNEGYFMALKELKRNPHVADSLWLNTYGLPQTVADSLAHLSISTPVHIDERVLTTAREWVGQRDLWKSDKRGLPSLLR